MPADLPPTGGLVRRWWANLFGALSVLVGLKLLLVADQVVGSEAYASPASLLAKLPLLLGWDVVGAAGVATLASLGPWRAWSVAWQVLNGLLGGVSYQLTRIIGGPLTKAGIDVATMQEAGGASTEGPALASSIGRYWTADRLGVIGGAMLLGVVVWWWRLRRPPLSRHGARAWGGGLAAAAAVTVLALPWMVNGHLFGLRVHTYGLERSAGVALAGSYLSPLFARQATRSGDPWSLDLSASTPPPSTLNPLRRARPRPTGVVLVSMESVGAPYLRDPSVMPFVSSVGDTPGGVRFPAHYSVWPQTMKAFFSLFCAELPFPDYRTIPSVNPAIPCTSLSEALHGAGWRTALITSADLGYDRKMRFFRHRAFDHVVDMHTLPDQEGAWKDSWGVEEDVAIRHLIRWTQEEPNRPWFVFYEMITAHHPYNPTQEMADNPMPDDRSAYLRALRYIDDRMRDLTEGLGPEALVVMLADHGEGFGQHPGSLSHGAKIWQEAIHVPMVMKGPQLAGISGEVGLNTSHIDVAPTLLGLLGVPVPCTMRGRDLTRSSEPRISFMGGRPPGAQMGAVDGRWKYIRNDSGAEMLFDLVADPDERVDRAAERADLVATLRARVVDWEAFGTRLIPDYAALLQASECAAAP